jgi:hypothetical protein
VIGIATLLLAACDDSPIVEEWALPCPFGPCCLVVSPTERLRYAYETRNFPLFAQQLAGPEDGGGYEFVAYGWVSEGPVRWRLEEELLIHRRMFQPQATPAGESPLPAKLWPTNISISLTPLSEWRELSDLYRSEKRPSGLDPSHWRAWESRFHAIVYVESQPATGLRIDGLQRFVVLEDLTKHPCDDRGMLIYRWEDLGPSGDPGASLTWSQVKRLYAPQTDAWVDPLPTFGPPPRLAHR